MGFGSLSFSDCDDEKCTRQAREQFEIFAKSFGAAETSGYCKRARAFQNF